MLVEHSRRNFLTEGSSPPNQKLINVIPKKMSKMVVTRFNNQTLESNKRFRLRHNVGCLYGSPFVMKKFGIDDVVFVIEMNNQENRVEGIGMVLNIVKTGAQYNTYDNYNYNRFVYCGKYRLDRSDLETLTCKAIDVADPNAPENPPINVLQMLDQVLFKGRSHMKRGTQVSSLTDKLIYRGGTTCKKLQHAIVTKFVEHFQTSITLRENFTYREYRCSTSPPMNPPSSQTPSPPSHPSLP
jgi:hypothetical protein